MGTSSSNPGPGGDSPLVPPWADLDGQGPGPEPEPQRFKQFRIKLGQFARSRADADLKSALGHYSRKSLGGSATAVRRLAPVARAGSQLLGFLTNVATGGDGAEWLGFNISELVGKDVDDVIDVIVNALRPPGGVPDDEAIRQGMDQALSNCMEIQENFDPTALTQEMIANLLMEYLSEEVFLRIVNDSGDALNKPEDAVQAVQAENDLREFINSVVDVLAGPRLQEGLFQGRADDWGSILQEIIQEVFEEFEEYY